jgi:hypothetical protein
MRRFALAALTMTLAGAAGCGGGGGAGRHGAGNGAAAGRPVPSRLTVTDVRRELGNGFRQGLYQLAVMAQSGDGAVDLGQALPTGALDGVRCAPAAAGTARGGWRCTVRWHGVGGGPRTTRYAVQPRGARCFTAEAQPALGPRYDSTIHAYSEHPLNLVTSTVSRC